MANDHTHLDKAKDIAKMVQQQEDHNQDNKTDKLDRIVMHPVFGLLIFAGIMLIVFTLSQTFIGPLVSDYLLMAIGWIAGGLEQLMVNLDTSDFVSGLLLEGVIGGFAAVIGFLPLIMVLFFLLQLLEDSGYMTRVAVVMDRYFRKIGLAGKSIIPMYVGTACSIPAIMSSRTIKNERQRKLTILLTPFVPCGAKLPVIALFISVFFGGAGWLTVSTYFLAILVILIAGLLMKFLLNVKEEVRTFDQYHFLELPNYQAPSLKNAFKTMLDRAWEFIVKAGTIIVLMNGLVWILSNFDFSFSLVSNPDHSMLKFIAQPIAFFLTPLGFGVWGLAAAAILGFIAKEEVVGALAVIFAFGISDDLAVENIELTRNILMTTGGLTAVSAFAYMAFNLFTPPCFAAIGAMNTELGSKKLTLLAVLFQLVIGYLVAMMIYQIGTLVFYQELGQGFIPSVIVFALVVLSLISIKIRRVSIHG
jgi:ferrous iron transport protein B